MKPKRIEQFQGEYRFLSNFWPVPNGIVLDGVRYTSVEHAYQASKTMDKKERAKIYMSPRPGDAKRLGRHVTMRPDWLEVRLEMMEGFIRQKFSQGGGLQLSLLETGDAELVEGNSWGDKFWGVSAADGVGQNHLGKILMKIRREIRS